MITVAEGPRVPDKRGIRVVGSTLEIALSDGRRISAPLEWYPRLREATRLELQNLRLIGNGVGIHWPDLDEDVSVVAILAGKRSGESNASLTRWRAARGRKNAEVADTDPKNREVGSHEVNRRTMMVWVEEALKVLGGKASITDIAREVWKRHEKEIVAAGDAFYDWQYELRWSGALLRKSGILAPAAKARSSIWELKRNKK